MVQDLTPFIIKQVLIGMVSYMVVLCSTHPDHVEFPSNTEQSHTCSLCTILPLQGVSALHPTSVWKHSSSFKGEPPHPIFC